MKPRYLYCDASFSREHSFAIAGLLAFENKKINDRNNLEEAILLTHEFACKNNIQAELKGMCWVLEWLTSMKVTKNTRFPTVQIYSDCKAIVDLPNRRKRLEAKDFKSQKTGAELNHADAYKKLYSFMDSVPVDLHWVKGHSSKKGQTAQENTFSVIDRYVRKLLRSKVTKLEESLIST